jgi:hypothetical protein
MKKVFIKTVVLLVIVLIIIVSSCKKSYSGHYNHTPATGATGPAGPSLTGNLEGVLFLYDDGGNKILSATALTCDTIMLINNSSGAVLTTTTSSTGSYTFTGISTGTYSMTAMKHGYGTVNAYGIQFAGGGNDYKNFSLAQIPTNSVTTISVSTSTAGIIVTGTAPANVGLGSLATSDIIVYVSLPNNTSVSSVPSNYSVYSTCAINSSNTTFNCSFTTTNLNQLGFTSGNTVYFAAYVVGLNGSSYTDPATGLTVFTALSSTPVTTFCNVP